MRMWSLLVGLVALVALPSACGNPEYGIGLGQPPYPQRSVFGTADLGLFISSVFVAGNPAQATTSDAKGYMTLVNRGSTAIDFNQVALSLVASRGSVSLNPAVLPALQTPLAANGSVSLTDASLAPFAQRLNYLQDQVVIVDDAFVVQAYLAWGAAAPNAPTPAAPAALPAFTLSAVQSAAISRTGDNFFVIATGSTATTSNFITNPGPLPQ